MKGVGMKWVYFAAGAIVGALWTVVLQGPTVVIVAGVIGTLAILFAVFAGWLQR